MKKFKLLFVFVFVFLLCGCKNKYTLTYVNGSFNEELVISDISEDEEKVLLKYVDGSQFLVIDENNSYQYKTDDMTKTYLYDMGGKFVVSPIINTCFEDVYIIDEKDYIFLETSGEYYCDIYDIEVVFKTDKVVMYNNAKSVDNNIYKWDSLEDGIKIQFSKTKLASVNNNRAISKNVNSLYVRLIICVVFVIIVIFTVSYLKKRNSE